MTLWSRFDWDAGNLAKCQKHGVTTAEIEHVLGNDPFLFPDYEHSQVEERGIAIGFNQVGRPAGLRDFHSSPGGGRGMGPSGQCTIYAPQGDQEI